MASWHRPWESTRDRSTFALGFSSALVTDVFVELSRSFLLALRQGLVQNPPAYASEATIRPGDLYYLHKMMHATHDLAIKMMCALGTSPRLERFLFRVNFILLLLLVVVHLAFLCPSTQLQSSQNLSEFLAAEGWNHCQAESNSTLVRLELLDTMWARQPPKPPTEIGTNLSEAVPPSFNWMMLIYDAVIPRPSYEIAVGEDASWLLVSSQMRENLGVHVKELQVSVQDQRFFGPYWARTLMSIFELYDIYVLHALPQFTAHCPQPALHVRLSSNPRVTVPLLLFQHRSAQLRSRWFRQRLREVVVTLGVLLVFLLAAILFSSFLRSLLVLSCRMYVNNQFCLRHLRRYAFIAQEMRRVNRAASTVLLELWVAWGASMLILLWIIAEAGRHSVAWPFWILCYVSMEFYGLAHVRSQQSRWIFPRVTLLLNAGAAIYAFWWPWAPQWLLVSLVLWSHFTLCFTLMSNYDYCFSLPPQPPHQLWVSSLLLPAVTLSRQATQGTKNQEILEGAQPETGT